MKTVVFLAISGLVLKAALMSYAGRIWSPGLSLPTFGLGPDWGQVLGLRSRHESIMFSFQSGFSQRIWQLILLWLDNGLENQSKQCEELLKYFCNSEWISIILSVKYMFLSWDTVSHKLFTKSLLLIFQLECIVFAETSSKPCVYGDSDCAFPHILHSLSCLLRLESKVKSLRQSNKFWDTLTLIVASVASVETTKYYCVPAAALSLK